MACSRSSRGRKSSGSPHPGQEGSERLIGVGVRSPTIAPTGHIVVVASLSGRISYVGEALYATSKWAAVGLAGVLRKEALRHGVRTTLIEPGLVDTPLSRASPLGQEELGQVQPLTAADVAATIVFALAQPQHVNLTEVVIQPTGEAY
jgi:NADP-dependent 3-hydroxy acid dehydrogenase YdfG